MNKLKKLSKIDFSMQNFTADFLRDFTKNVKICLLNGRLSTCHQIQTFQRFSFHFLISYDLKSATRRQLVNSISGVKIVLRFRIILLLSNDFALMPKLQNWMFMCGKIISLKPLNKNYFSGNFWPKT